jgi:cyclase
VLKKRIIPKVMIRKIPGMSVQYSAFVSIKYDSYSKIGSLGSQLRIFESNRVDELLVINADKSEQSISDSFLSYVSEAISGLKTPVTMGGGIKSLEDAEKLISVGADKLLVGLNTPDFALINDLAKRFGSQAVTGSFDYYLERSRFTLRGNSETPFDLDDFLLRAASAQSAGIGELLLNCIDNDGSKNGLELNVVSLLSAKLQLPLILTSGAGRPEHFVSAFESGADAVSAGTYFSKLDQSPLQLRSRLLNQGIRLRK